MAVTGIPGSIVAPVSPNRASRVGSGTASPLQDVTNRMALKRLAELGCSPIKGKKFSRIESQASVSSGYASDEVGASAALATLRSILDEIAEEHILKFAALLDLELGLPRDAIIAKVLTTRVDAPKEIALSGSGSGIDHLIRVLSWCFPNTQKITISGWIQELPKEIRSFPNLKHLIIKNSLINSLPSWIRFIKLESLVLEELNIGDKCETFGFQRLDHSRLKSLAISNCGMTDIPSALADCESLTELALDNNPIHYWDSRIQLKKIRFLDLSNCELTQVPSIGSYMTLTRLCLSKNRIRDLSGLQHYRNLQSVSLQSNCIDGFGVAFSSEPPADGDLQYGPMLHLKSMDMSGNPIEEITQAFVESFPELEEVFFSNCELLPLPVEIEDKVEGTPPSVIDPSTYLRLCSYPLRDPSLPEGEHVIDEILLPDGTYQEQVRFGWSSAI